MKNCYTCKMPNGIVKNHMICTMDMMSFHYDIWARPMFIATPHKHYHTLFELSERELKQLWDEINNFIHNIMHLPDFQILINNGKWQTHHHLHIKIKADEKTILDKRRIHLNHPKVFSKLN